MKKSYCIYYKISGKKKEFVAAIPTKNQPYRQRSVLAVLGFTAQKMSFSLSHC